MVCDKMRSNFEWFVDAMPGLYQRYGECWVVIHDRRVTSVHDTFGEACDMAERVFRHGEFNVQHVGPDESAYTARVSTSVSVTRDGQ